MRLVKSEDHGSVCLKLLSACHGGKSNVAEGSTTNSKWKLVTNNLDIMLLALLGWHFFFHFVLFFSLFHCINMSAALPKQSLSILQSPCVNRVNVSDSCRVQVRQCHHPSWSCVMAEEKEKNSRCSGGALHLRASGSATLPSLITFSFI